MPRSISTLQVLLSLALSASVASGYSFTIASQPQQCSNLSIQVTGAGQPPYSIVVIPFGPTPLPNNVEVRTIVYKQFSGDSSSITFPLNYPASSQFVAVVSDSTGFGTGGTSVATTVMDSSNSGCFNPNQTVSLDFPFNIYPPNQIVQCSPTRLWWNSDQVQGTPSFQGVIPGGESFSIPTGQLSNVDNEGTGFNWTPSVRAGSTLLIVAGDNRGIGTGGSGVYNVGAGLYPNSSCLTDTSPSSTAGPPAGGVYPTGATDSSSGSSNHTGSIVGGVIGGLAAIVVLALVGFYIIRRKTAPRSQKERPVDLLQEDPEDNELPSNSQPPQYLRPEPYLITAPTEISTAYALEDGGRSSFTGSGVLYDSLDSSRYGTSSRRQSGLTALTNPRSITPERERDTLPSGSTANMTIPRKTPMPRQLRPVNIIQHEDAGPDDGEGGEQETIELPPAYTNIRKTS